MVDLRCDKVHADDFAVTPAGVHIIPLSGISVKVDNAYLCIRRGGENALNDAVLKKNGDLICHRYPPSHAHALQKGYKRQSP